MSEPESVRPTLGPSLVFLIGPRGSGKTTVARLLAAALGWDWADADEVLERRHGQTIRAIFADQGEAGFRDREEAILRDLCALRRHVIATGGGVVLRPANRALLRDAGCVVWLSGDADTLWQRLQADETTPERRPALGGGGRAEVEEVLRVREPLYRACAHLCVDTTGRPPSAITQEVLAWLAGPRPAE
jgi:shikimate kinase